MQLLAVVTAVSFVLGFAFFSSPFFYALKNLALLFATWLLLLLACSTEQNAKVKQHDISYDPN